jgi:ADP-heptose:LPS heptosyltransferase
LQADPVRIAAWRERLAALGPGLKIGISWQGGTHKSRRPVRSLPLAKWQPILQATHAHFIDLQYLDFSAELAAQREATGVQVHSWEAVRADYEETAALVSALDLVISVCTAVIHLGGALGRPVWVMAPFSPEWRYGSKGEEMPWYPSVRVFRQPAYGDWDAVIANVARSLRELVNASAGQGALRPG